MILAIPAVAACLDLSLFSWIFPADIRFIRRLQRDQADRGRSVSRIIDQYLNQVRPMHETFVAPCRKTAESGIHRHFPISRISSATISKVQEAIGPSRP